RATRSLLLEAVTQADTDGQHLVAINEGSSVSIRSDRVQVGALGQVIGVAYAVDVHGFQILVGIGTLPRREDVAGAADGCADTDQVRVDLQAIPRKGVVGAALALRRGVGVSQA